MSCKIFSEIITSPWKSKLAMSHWLLHGKFTFPCFSLELKQKIAVTVRAHSYNINAQCKWLSSMPICLYVVVLPECPWDSSFESKMCTKNRISIKWFEMFSFRQVEVALMLHSLDQVIRLSLLTVFQDSCFLLLAPFSAVLLSSFILLERHLKG